jgi:hypothetical protein
MRHWYLDHYGNLRKRRRIRWSRVAGSVLTVAVVILAGIGMVAVLFAVSGATL